MVSEKKIKEITWRLAGLVPSIGGGRDDIRNPITHAMKDLPPMFVTGVDIERVVRFVIANIKAKKKRKR